MSTASPVNRALRIGLVTTLLAAVAGCSFSSSGLGLGSPDDDGGSDDAADLAGRDTGGGDAAVDTRPDGPPRDRRPSDGEPPDGGGTDADGGDSGPPDDLPADVPGDSGPDGMPPDCPPQVILSGTAGVRDTTLVEKEPGLAHDGEASLTLDSGNSFRRVILMRFDLAPYVGCQVVTANLDLFVLEGTTEMVAVHRVKQAWEAGATWNEAFPSTGNEWSNPGCDDGAAGTCREEPPVLSFPPTDQSNVAVQVVVPPQAIQDWLDGTLRNDGFLFNLSRGPAHNLRLVSSEAAEGPRLTLALAAP